MSRAIAIFRKDVRHLWVQILVYVGTLVLFACEDPAYVKHDSTTRDLSTFLYILLPLACWLLVTSLMQGEKTVGDNQYWLTRPFSRIDLLVAKALFLLLFLIAPVFVCNSWCWRRMIFRRDTISGRCSSSRCSFWPGCCCRWPRSLR